MSEPSSFDVLRARPMSLEALLLDVVQQAVIATDMNGDVVFWNAYAERLFGWRASEAIGRPIVELTPSESTRDDAIAIMERLQRGESWSGEFGVRRKDGTQFTAFVVNSPILDEDGALAGIVGISTDVSERRALEHRVQQAAKMEAIGRLAGGVAHDFNNLLTVILGHADMTLHEGHADERTREAMLAVYDAAERAAELTRQLLAFSRQQLVSPRVVDLGDALGRMMPMLRRLIPEDVEIVGTIEPGDLHAVIDPTQFDQVVMNLAVNARDSMPQGGRLELRLEPVAYADQHAPVDPDGGYLRLVVRDTGHGMPPDVLAHAFEPFFTTKDVQHGTGIGLATVYGIVEQAGGVVEVESTEGLGTTFSIMLSRVQSTAGDGDVDAATPAVSSNGRTVLLVEDEPALRTLTMRILSTAGFTVIAADRGDTAVEVAERHSGTIDLLLTDVVMPGESGVALAKRLREHRPELAVLLMSGYAEAEMTQLGEPSDAMHLLRKPFVAARLVAAVHSLLGNAPVNRPG